MKFLLACLTFLISIQPAFSQDEYLKGFIVKKTGDTVRGIILSEIEEDLNVKVNFKENQNGLVKAFHPGEIESFGIDEEIFRSLNFLNTSLDTPLIESCFGKQLVLGKYELYTFSRKEKRFYLIKAGESSQLLFDSYYTNMGDIVQEGNFSSRLRMILNECPSVSHKYQSLEFGQKQMSGYLENLDNCLAPASVKTYYHKTKTNIIPYIYSEGLPAAGFDQFAVEAGIRFNSPSLSKRTYLNLSLRYSYLNDVQHDNDKSYPNIIYTTTTQDLVISLPLTIQYNFINSRIRPSAYAGFSLLYDKATQTSNIPYVPPIPTGFGFSPVFGIAIEGYITKHLFIRADERFEIYLQYPSFGLGYQF